MPTVEIELCELVELLIAGNVTDPERWPPEARDGAGLLARIRAIEAECIAAQGEFDWDTLDEDTQDEYDGLCVGLDKIRERLDPQARSASLADVRRELGLPVLS